MGMEQLAFFGQFLGGLGLFFTGVGVLWFVTVHIFQVHRNVVPRPRLIEQLNAGLRLGRKLNLISAPE